MGGLFWGFILLSTEEKLYHVGEKQFSMLFLCQEKIIFIQDESFYFFLMLFWSIYSSEKLY